LRGLSSDLAGHRPNEHTIPKKRLTSRHENRASQNVIERVSRTIPAVT
jgi:hypothetical protein